MSDVESHSSLVAHGRKILAEVRAKQAEDRERNERFAATVESPNKKYVYRVEAAAEMVAEAIGAPFGDQKLRHSGCPYVIKARIAYWAEDDLRKLAEEILNSAPIRRGRPLKPRRRKT
jgi:hypothetical protein